MKAMLKLVIGFALIYASIGCIAEEYDFDPPIVTLIDYEDSSSIELILVNLDWTGERNILIKKETKDIVFVAKQQEPLNSNSRKKIDLHYNHHGFEIDELSLSLLREKDEESDSMLWDDDEWKDWQISYDHFMTPLEKGNYVIVIDLNTDRGTAQYVGHLIID